MNTIDTDDRTPQEIERSIADRRDALKGKLTELEYRLSPTERMKQVRQRIDPQAIAPWAAVGAVATGAWLAARGLRHHSANGYQDLDETEVDGVEQIICVDLNTEA